MKILFISTDLIAGSLAHELVKEGHDVRLFVKEKGRQDNFDNIITKTKNWRKDLPWVGKDGLIIFDDVGYGKIQDTLRKKGYRVVGGSELGDKLELDREFGQAIFTKYGLQTVDLKDFENIDDAVMYAKEHPSAWVVKRNNSIKFVSYVGIFDDGRDVIDLLKNYMQNKATSDLKLSLQKRVYGVEIGVARFFNGFNWVGPIEFNIEHTRFLPGDIGPTTSEMGTLAWYSEDENNKLYRETLLKMEPYLREVNFKGDFALNCIVNETGAYILEATSRFGSPIIHLQNDVHLSPWGDFLSAIADGKDFDLKWKKGYGIVTLLAVPPFPYSKKVKENYFYGIHIHFKGLTEEEKTHIHLEEVSLRKETGQLYVSDTRGYILYVTSIADTVEESQKLNHSIAERIIIPKIMYRNDIGSDFIKSSQKLLQNWGYID
jgi:phosphoribosylamine--glycine ligase